MVYLGNLMLTENNGRNDASYYAHRVEVIEREFENKREKNNELSMENIRLRTQINMLKKVES